VGWFEMMLLIPGPRLLLLLGFLLQFQLAISPFALFYFILFHYFCRFSLPLSVFVCWRRMLALLFSIFYFPFSIFRFSFSILALPLCFCWCSIMVSFDLFSVSSDFRQHSTLYGCFRLVLVFHIFFGAFLVAFQAKLPVQTFVICGFGPRGFPRGFLLHFCLAFDLRCLIVSKRLRTLCF